MKNVETGSIEDFFLNTLLGVGLIGIVIVLATDALINPSDKLSLIIDSTFLTAFTIAGIFRKKYPVLSVLIITSVALLAMLFQSLAVPVNTTTSLSIILVVGFIISVMLKGKIMVTMHLLALGSVNAIFIIQYRNPALRFSHAESDVISVAVTFTILYAILAYATSVLKARYDTSNRSLNELYNQLQERNSEIVAQNEELLQIQDNLSELNLNLEEKVAERTAKIQLQNEILIKYSYANAHHLRGPVARLLGLANVYALAHEEGADFFIQKMKEEAQNIDDVIKKINEDLSTPSLD
jgi:signal transduction histidine kinase